MKKYYAIINAYKYQSKDSNENRYCVEWILQSKYPVRWSKKIFFEEEDFNNSFSGVYDLDKPNLWLNWKYLEAIESIEVVREMRQWYWRKNYSVKWFDIEFDHDTAEKKYVVHALLESEYSVASMRNFSFTVDQFTTLFGTMINSEEKCHWIKDKILEVVESYKIVDNPTIE